MKEYEETAIKVGGKVGIEINKVDSGGIWRSYQIITLCYFTSVSAHMSRYNKRW